jgi:Tfp pilus assembly protein PilO
MMGIRQDRLWAAGGTFVALLLLALSWFLLINPQHERTDEFNAQTRSAQEKAGTLQRRLVELQAENGKLDEYKAELASNRRALPTTAGMSDFLRELQTTANDTGVTVNTLIVGGAGPVTNVPNVFAVPLTLNVTGSATNLPTFLDRLQRVEPRAVLIGSVNAVPEGTSTTITGSVTLTVTMQAFVAPPTAGKPAPAPTG